MNVDLDFILWIVGGSILAAGVALGMAKLAFWFQGKMAIKKAEKFLDGTEKNEFLMDGEKININKMIVKDLDGNMKKVIIPLQSEIVQPKPSNA